ncbi:MAG: hypothetical protein ACLTSG_10760 [Lachnospiraceae bacterium]
MGFDKVYWFPEGNFCVSWYYEPPGGGVGHLLRLQLPLTTC